MLAARFGFNGKNIKLETIAGYWEICVDDVRTLLESEEYRLAIEGIMRASQSLRQFLKWIETSRHAVPSAFASRMRISEADALKIIEKVKQDIRTGRYLHERKGIGHSMPS